MAELHNALSSTETRWEKNYSLFFFFLFFFLSSFPSFKNIFNRFLFSSRAITFTRVMVLLWIQVQNKMEDEALILSNQRRERAISHVDTPPPTPPPCTLSTPKKY